MAHQFNSASFAIFLAFAQRKIASTIQYGYRKCVTHARVFFHTLAHGNSKIEIIQRDRGRRQAEKCKNGKK